MSANANASLWWAVAAFVVAGCGNTAAGRPQLQGFGPFAAADRGGRSMLKGEKGDLLYLSDAQSKVYVYSYPQGKLAFTLTGLNAPMGECADASGDVWITLFSAKEIVEYAHGGSQPIATLDDPGLPFGCAVDPASGNLAVSNIAISNYPGSIEVYADAKGTPTTYTLTSFPSYYYCAYDYSGNLFAGGGNPGFIAELPEGGNALQLIRLSQNLETLSMQWDGSYFSVVGFVVGGPKKAGGKEGPVQVNRVSVSGSTGTIVSEQYLKSPNGKHINRAVQYWIAGKTIIGPGFFPHGQEGVLTWRYPKGGLPTKSIRARIGPWGVALSRGTSTSLAARP